MSNPVVPPDVLVEILVRLPVESIVRFRCVSKAWNSLISSASFISAQTRFATSLARKSNILLLSLWDNCPMKFDDQPTDEFKKLSIPLASLKGLGFRVNGSCHGLVCMSSTFRFMPNLKDYYSIETIIIWNPVLSISLKLPEFSLKTPDYYPHTAAFGFDAKRNDYKVIRIPSPYSGVPRQYEVFELSQNAWKTVTPNKFLPDLWDLPPVYLNGSAHWISELATIVAFGFIDEAFLEMNFPGALMKMNPCQDSVKILVKEGRYLSAILYSHCPYENNGTICVWVMKEYGVERSWTKLFLIHDPGMGIPQEPYCFRTNGELLVRNGDDMVVSYDCNTNTETCVGDCSIEFVVEHTETLALLQVPGTSKVKYKKRALETTKKV